MRARDDSDRVNGIFAHRSRDLTPVAVRNAVHVLYVPVSYDPEVTRRCAAILSDPELQTADRFATQADRVLFIQRRAFRRFCAASVTGSSLPLSQITFNETENGRPYLCDLPDVWFSFSSCRFGFVGAWSSTHAVGVDLEDPTRDLEATELARQFFSITEANVVERAGGPEHLGTFFQFWMFKEAALKSIGEGLPFGLDAFEFELVPDLRVAHVHPDHGRPEQFNAHVIKGTDGCAALVIRSLT